MEVSCSGDELLGRALLRATEGDAVALDFLYARFAGDVCAHIESVLRDPGEAEALTRALFAKLPLALRRYEHSELPFTTWIRLLARQVALDHLRRHAPFSRTPQAEAREGGL